MPQTPQLKSFFVAKIVSFLLFIILLTVGTSLAKYKPLWTDEIYSQVRSIEKLSYGAILLGPPGEGNTCPFFYLIQKTICDIFHYKVHAYKWVTSAEFDKYPFTPADEASMNKLLGVT